MVFNEKVFGLDYFISWAENLAYFTRHCRALACELPKFHNLLQFIEGNSPALPGLVPVRYLFVYCCENGIIEVFKDLRWCWAMSNILQ